MGWAMDGKLGPKPHLTPTKGYILFVHKRTQNEGLISLSACRLFVLRKLGQTTYTCNPSVCPYLGISADGEKEEFVNEARTVEDLGLFIPMLKLDLNVRVLWLVVVIINNNPPYQSSLSCSSTI